MGDEKLIIISVAVRGINDHIRFYSQMLCTSLVLTYCVFQGCSPKKKWGTPETRLRERFLNNLDLHTRTLIHVRKIATADLWSCPAIQLLVFECL